METIAVYWEENIKTYGIQFEGNLSLLRTDIPSSAIPELGRQLTELGRRDAPVRLMLAHQHAPETLGLIMVFENGWEDRLSEFFSAKTFAAVCPDFRLDFPVEMLNFHGPHFGDRYGIATAADHALKKEKIRYIAMGCSAASVHILFPENTAVQAKSALKTVFKTP